MAHFITLKSLTDRVKQTAKSFSDGLPYQSKNRLARKLLLWAVNTYPGPPVDTGRLLHSGTAFIGSKKAYNLGGSSGNVVVNEPDSVITITFSAPKKVKDKATQFYHFKGSRWFDYASFQHVNHATNKLWTSVLLAKNGTYAAYKEEVLRTMRHIW